MAYSFFRTYVSCALLLPLSHFLILFGNRFLPFGSFRLNSTTDTNQEAPQADIVVKPQKTEDDSLSSFTVRWRPGTGVASAGPPLQNLHLEPKIIFFFLPKTALGPTKNGQMKGNGGYSTHAPRLPHAKRPYRAGKLHNMSANRPRMASKCPLCTFA